MTHIKGAGQDACDRSAMTGILKSLSAHHTRVEKQLVEVLSAARAAEWLVYRSRFAELHAEMAEHIAFEELELFPELARALGADVQLDELREHHERLRRHFDTLGAAAPEHDPKGCMDELEELHALIREHHESECRMCYPESDRLLGRDSSLGRSASVISGSRLAAVALDLRGLQPPEPIVRIFEALDRSPAEPLRVILPHEPAPLYSLLRERGFRYVGKTRPDGGFELLIEKA